MNKAKHYCDNINCNHNDTKGLCCLFNPDNCKYRQLQKENAELKKAYDETQELLDKQIEATYKLDKENAELKEKLECAEKARDYWKDSSFDWRHKCTSRKPFKVAVKAQEQLTKAKEIIKELMSFSVQLCDCRHTVDFEKTREEAEQFISEVER